MTRPEPGRACRRIDRVDVLVWGILAPGAGFWTYLYRDELPRMWGPYALGLSFLAYVAWLFRPRVPR